MKDGNQKRKNIYFRQTPKEFRSQKQNSIFHHIKTNISYHIYTHGIDKINDVLSKIRGGSKVFETKLPTTTNKTNLPKRFGKKA